jgi:type I restriction enzyme S subunit
MKNLITEHIDIWTTAQIVKTNGSVGRGNGSVNQSIYGIKKLRELILELAVRGKLVQQCAGDEPASGLLKKIAKEKARLVKEGKIKKQEPLPEIGEDEKPFELPKGWEWARLGNISYQITDGTHYTPVYVPEGIPFLSVKDMSSGYLDFSRTQFISQEQHTELIKRCNPQRGNLLLTKVGTTGIPVLIETDRPFSIFVSVALIKFPQDEISGRFLSLLIKSPLVKVQSDEGTEGIGNKNLVLRKITAFSIIIPPLDEQNRIVTKVDELMALCDRLEQQQTDNNTAHQSLVEILLVTLTSAADQDEFAEAWQRIANHFDILFTTEQSIDQLKQTILQLAVMGKLVPKDPNNEPASVLLEKIAKEKARLVKEGKIKKQEPLPEIGEDEKPFDLPEGWEWSRIGKASLFTEYGMSEKTFDGIKGVPILTMGDIKSGKVLLGGQKLVLSSVNGLPALYIKNGDILYNRTNSAELVGKTGIYIGPDNIYTFASYLIRIRCFQECVNSTFLNLAMNAPLFRITQIKPHLKQQCGQANVNATIMKNMIVPLPPLAEQHRIVAKVDELMALCDTLKQRINDAQTTQVQLADAIVEQALA